jgi:hypothetical protein
MARKSIEEGIHFVGGVGVIRKTQHMMVSVVDFQFCWRSSGCVGDAFGWGRTSSGRLVKEIA